MNIKEKKLPHNQLKQQGYEILKEAKANGWMKKGSVDDQLFRIYATQLGIKITD